ncbi:MAG: GFA family protein, partial [Myxococcales bacterium]|nr:GFA family protein [Myxococcales bacterium]
MPGVSSPGGWYTIRGRGSTRQETAARGRFRAPVVARRGHRPRRLGSGLDHLRKAHRKGGGNPGDQQTRPRGSFRDSRSKRRPKVACGVPCERARRRRTSRRSSAAHEALSASREQRHPRKAREGSVDEPITGGCACGAVRYECDTEPMCSWVCHCRECQRSTGGGGAVNAVFNIAHVKFTRGEPKFHHDVGTSGEKTHRGFCADCGSPIAAKADLLPHIHGISAASFDDPGRIELVAHIWT